MSRSETRRFLTVGLVLTVLLGALFALLWQLKPQPTPKTFTGDWYYDLNTNQLFPGPLGAIPPIAAPSGPLADGTPAGVRAHVYGCGDCSEARRAIAYLETYSAESQQRLRQLRQAKFGIESAGANRQLAARPDDGALLVGEASLVKRPTDPEWVVRGSAAGQAIVTGSLPRCPPGVFPRECPP